MSGHFREVETVDRVLGPAGLEAVVVVESGTNLGVYVVREGAGVIGRERAVALIHVNGIQIQWVDAQQIRLEGEFDEIVEGAWSVQDRDKGWVLVQAPSRRPSLFDRLFK